MTKQEALKKLKEKMSLYSSKDKTCNSEHTTFAGTCTCGIGKWCNCGFCFNCGGIDRGMPVVMK